MNEVFGFSYNDAKAMLAQAMEVETADQIPLDPLRANAKVDSDVEHLNQVLEGVRISRNLPRSQCMLLCVFYACRGFLYAKFDSVIYP